MQQEGPMPFMAGRGDSGDLVRRAWQRGSAAARDDGPLLPRMGPDAPHYALPP
jgi:hypothetical protein